MARRKAWRVPEQSDRQLYFASAEDTVLQKLNGYRLGGETSERQWHDIIGVIKVQSENLDGQYLKQWAESLGLSDPSRQGLQRHRVAQYPLILCPSDASRNPVSVQKQNVNQAGVERDFGRSCDLCYRRFGPASGQDG